MCTSSRFAMHQYGVQSAVVEDVALTQYMQTFIVSSALVVYSAIGSPFCIMTISHLVCHAVEILTIGISVFWWIRIIFAILTPYDFRLCGWQTLDTLIKQRHFIARFR